MHEKHIVTFLVFCLIVEIHRINEKKSGEDDELKRTGLDNNLKSPEDLLQANPNIWLTFLLKVYYQSLTWMIHHRGKAMKNCHVDSDWIELHMDLNSWMEILDQSMIECIHEKRIRKVTYADDTDEFNQFNVMKLQMFVVVSELFCLRLLFIYRQEYCIHWKNHYHPEQIFGRDKFIWWLFDYSQYNWKFAEHLLEPSIETNTIITCTEEDRLDWNPRLFRTHLNY